MRKNSLCYCNSNLLFSECCQPFLDQTKLPTTAEALMRSRYSAFNTNNVDYLIDTLAANKRQHDDRQQIQTTIDNTHWLGLKIISGSNLSKNKVEFVAFFQQEKDHVGQLHENSCFIQQQNRWFYVDGEQLPPLKLKRNDICFCGSGKKIKKCHLV